MGLENLRAWADRNVNIVVVITSVVLALIAVFSFLNIPFLIVGIIATFLLGLILGRFSHSIRTQSSSPSPPPKKSLFYGIYRFDRFNWPYEVKIQRDDIKRSKVVHIDNPICPGCDTEAIIKEHGYESGEFAITFLTCPQTEVHDRKSCKVKKDRELNLKDWKDFVRKHIEGDIRTGKIKPTITK